MAHYPTTPRISQQPQQANVSEFQPIDMRDPEPAPVLEPATVTETPPSSVPDQDDSVSAASEMRSEPAAQPQAKKRPGRPKGPTPATKSSSTPELRVPAKKKNDSGDKKRHTCSLYLYASDHKYLRLVTAENDFTLNGFAEAACLDTLYHSYRCADPDCGCEFVLRNERKDGDYSCPACGNKKLHHLFGR